MSFKTKDLEIIYNLRWKNVPKREDKKQMSIVAVYDIPATTLNFEVFKSYLLKNSGIAEDDVSVYYIMENGKEYPIQSQTDFQVALYAFRRKARVGEIINLLLERISDQAAHKMPKHSNDVETQSYLEPNSIVSTRCCAGDAAPQWFVAGLAQLKKEIKEEISANVSTVIAQAVADLKSSCPYKVKTEVKSKHEKRSKKPFSHGTIMDIRSTVKGLKYESKIDKLDYKALKYREKRLALQLKDCSAGSSNARKLTEIKAKERLIEEQKRQMEEEDANKSDEETSMDARPVNVQAAVPHMMGGEHYVHEWLVENTGKDQWTSLTSLQYTWGSKSLLPLKKSIVVPFLKPGEKGVICAGLYIPEEPGKYECYWQFMHKGRRFGHWLGAQVIVDPFTLNLPKNPYSYVEYKPSEARISAEALKPYYESMDREEYLKNASDDLAAFLLTEDEDVVKNDSDDSDCSSTVETPRQQIFSKDYIQEECVEVEIPECFIVDDSPKKQPEPVASTSTPNKEDNSFDDNNNAESLDSGSTIKITDDELDNMVLITLPKDERAKSGYINVHVDGQKVLIPVNLLNSNLVDAANRLVHSEPKSPKNDSPIQDPAMPKTLEEPIVPVQVQVTNNDNNVAVDLSTPTKNVPEVDENIEQRSNYFEANNYMSHCSAAGSCFSEVNASIDQQHRVFVFPQDNPGYELVYPVLDLNNAKEPTLINKPVVVPPSAPAAPQQNPIVEAVPNFQQTPPEMRRAPTVAEPPLYATAQRSHFGTPCVDTQAGFQQQEEPQPARPAPAQEAATPAAAAASQVHILPETLVNGAVNVASSAINTARSVINMMRPQSPGRWVNGHWVSANPETPREANLQALAEMGFWNRDLNATLLARFNDDLNRVVAELVQ